MLTMARPGGRLTTVPAFCRGSGQLFDSDASVTKPVLAFITTV
jgi:hypothetical protein